MRKRLALLAAIAAALPAAASAGSAAARLLVTANVVRSVQVSVSVDGVGSAALRVRTSGGAAWSADVAAAAGASGIALSPSAADPSYVVVTVLPDAPPPEAAASPPRS
jgi:hypothetical protein